MVRKVLYVLGGLLGVLTIVVLAFLLYFGYLENNQSRFVGPVEVGEPLPAALVSDLEKYVVREMGYSDVPGVAMVLVQGGQIVYQQGLGVRDLQSKEPVTMETLFGIGSSTKPMTAVMMAALVDEGVFDWDTPVTEIMPDFALANEELTEKVSMAHTLCMCTGVPRRVEEISVQYSEMAAEDIVTSLASLPLSGSFEQDYDYSSRMVAAGGYIAGMAAGGEYGALAQAYERQMAEKILEPLDMPRSTFSIDQAVNSGNYATPYYSALSWYEAIPPEIEGIFTPIEPAGALWSNTEEMAKFLIMLLNEGVSAQGQRIISAENLAYLWKVRINIDDKIDYGLGWNIEDYHGLQVFHHPGGTVGFTSELVIIPELDIGFALLTNRLNQVRPIGRMATYRLLEMLTGREQVYDQEVRKYDREIKQQVFSLALITRKKVNPDEVAPYLGKYHNEVLGGVELIQDEDNSLLVDFGEYASEIRPLVIEDNQYIFFESVFVGKTVTLSQLPAGRVTMSWAGDEGTYTFTPVGRLDN
jgi:CubicO group peptidase (beta-lactamase class C family)